MSEFRYPIREFPSKPTFDNLMSVLCFKDQALLRTPFSCFIMATCLKRKICTDDDDVGLHVLGCRVIFALLTDVTSIVLPTAKYYEVKKAEVCTGYFVPDSQNQCTRNTDVAAAAAFAAVVLLNVLGCRLTY